MSLFTIFCILCFVESGANPSAIGDNGKAIGIVQIHEPVIKDVRRRTRWYISHSDTYDVTLSWHVFRVYMDMYAKKPYTLEECARVWNGGPNGRKDTDYIRKAMALSDGFVGEQQIINLMVNKLYPCANHTVETTK
jgi:hypothetical protein